MKDGMKSPTWYPLEKVEPSGPVHLLILNVLQEGVPLFGREFLDGITEHRPGHTGGVQTQPSAEPVGVALAGIAQEPSDRLLKKVVKGLRFFEEDFCDCEGVVQLPAAEPSASNHWPRSS